MSASVVATASVIRAHSPSLLAGWGGTKIFSLMYPHTGKSRDVKSGDHGGEAIIPPHSIQATTVRMR